MLQPAEAARFEELDAIVDGRLRSVLELAIALREVRDRRLWRQHYANFESYLAEKGIAKRRGNQLAAHAWVVELLRLGTPGSQQGPPPELPERVTRELIPVATVAPERVRDVYEVAARSSIGTPTSAAVRSVARDFVRQAVPKPATARRPETRAPAARDAADETDGEGRTIEAEARPSARSEAVDAWRDLATLASWTFLAPTEVAAIARGDADRIAMLRNSTEWLLAVLAAL